MSVKDSVCLVAYTHQGLVLMCRIRNSEKRRFEHRVPSLCRMYSLFSEALCAVLARCESCAYQEGTGANARTDEVDSWLMGEARPIGALPCLGGTPLRSGHCAANRVMNQHILSSLPALAAAATTPTRVSHLVHAQFGSDSASDASPSSFSGAELTPQERRESALALRPRRDPKLP